MNGEWLHHNTQVQKLNGIVVFCMGLVRHVKDTGMNEELEYQTNVYVCMYEYVYSMYVYLSNLHIISLSLLYYFICNQEMQLGLPLCVLKAEK